MAEGRVESEWWRTASVVAMLAEVNRNPKKRQKSFEPKDFMPSQFKRKAPPSSKPLDVDAFMRLFGVAPTPPPDGKDRDHG